MSGESLSSRPDQPHPDQPHPGQPGVERDSTRESSGPVDLRLVALTPSRSHLVLEDSAARQYHVPVDERLAAALRTTTTRDRPGQLEIALESQLSPREIQARIRAGHSVEEVARAAGISADRVERYAGPVVAEREHVVEQALRAPGRRASAGSAPSLGELVQVRLGAQGAVAQATEWDAWRRDDDTRWTVRLAYLAADRARTAIWTFDPRSRVLTPADDEARWLVDDGAGERQETPAAPVRRLTPVPATDEPDAPASPADEVYDREADEARAAREEAARRAAAAARPANARHARRPAVPAWDDIMFGPRRRD